MKLLHYLWAGPRWLLTGTVILVVGLYRRLLRPFLPPMCRFQPSCSEYMLLAVHKHGPVCGACKGVYRILRCNPWNRGGYDPP